MGTYHKILGVLEGATEAEIKKAYRKLASAFHPDKNIGKSESEIQRKKEKFQEVQSAYDGLMEGRYGPEPSGFGSHDISKEVEEMMRRWGAQAHGFGSQVYTSTTEQSPVTQTIEVPIEKMLQGGIVNITTMVPIQSGRGILQFVKKMWTINLKTDTPVGHKYVMKENGKETTLIIMPADSPAYISQGIDILMEKDIDLFDALLGGSINIKHPSGASLKVRVPAGVTNESAIRVLGKGLLDTRGLRGNLYIQAIVKIPALDKKEVKILQEAVKKMRKNKA